MNFRHEYKHRINLLDSILVRQRLKPLMEYDENSKDDGTYFIKSLYFDNYTDKALREKLDGVNKREKFRIRYYNNDTSFIRLEKKSKINGLCLKEKADLTVEQCQKILDNDIEFLKYSNVELMQELYAKMQYQLLRPKNIVAYDRTCFVYGPGNVRITIDENIRGSYNVRKFLQPDVQLTHLYHTAVLEVKWDEYIPQVIKDAVQLKNRQPSAFSKYAAVRF